MSRTTKKKAIKKSNTVTAYDYTKDIRSYLKSSLFNSYYLEKGYVSKFNDSWIPDGDAWEHFYHGIIDFIETKSATFFLDAKPSESLTVSSYITPVMAYLGWDTYGRYNHFDTETTYDYDGKAYRPDLVYFETSSDQEKVQSLKGVIKKSTGKKRTEAQKKLRLHVEKKHNIVVEAKMFGLLKPMSKRKDEVKKDSTRDKTPEGQTVTYMEMLRSERGILTDGGIWKFFHNEYRDEGKYVSFDFGKLALWLIKKIQLEGFEFGNSEFKKDEEEFTFLLALFYNLFSKEAVLGDKIAHLVDHTKKYSEHLEDKIKNRFVMAVTHACNGLAYAVQRVGENPDDYIQLIKKTAESHLFNIIFFRSLESRGVLPYFGEDNSYDKLSISKTIDTIYENGFSPNQRFKSQLNMFEDYYQEEVDGKTTTICNNLIKLYKSVHKGISNGIHIEGFQESVFTKDEWAFAKKYKIPDEYMINVIFYLNLVPKDRDLDEYQLIPYDFLTPRELGSIFESFLEFQIEKAEIPMFWDHKRKQWKKNGDKIISLRKNEIIKKGEYFFTPDNKERKMTGAYYTPEYIVQYIVRNALGPECEEMTPKEILNFKVCDPAMGSGHFLKGALEYLTELYIDAHYKHDIKLNLSHNQAKKRILHNCIFGVDINPSAVKLCKMSMWLTTAFSEEKLEKLDDQIIADDTLFGTSWEKKLSKVCASGGFDAVIGNPPYLNLHSQKEIKEKIKGNDFLYEHGGILGDLVYLFILKGHKILKRDGVFSFITSRYYLENKFATNLRKWLKSNVSIKEIVDFGNKQVFKDANIHTSIIQTRNTFKKNNKFDVKTDLRGSVEVFTQEDLSDEKWTFSKEDTSLNFNVSKMVKLEEVFDMFKGIVTGSNKGFIISESELREFDFAKDYIYPIVRNSEIQKNRIVSNGKEKSYLLYFKDENVDKKVIQRFEKDFPERVELLKNRSEIKDGKRSWFVIDRSRAEFDLTEAANKIYTPYRSETNRFVLEDNVSLSVSDTTIIKAKVKLAKSRLRQIVKLLNSEEYTKYFLINGKKKGKVIEFLPGELASVLIPDPLSEDEFYNTLDTVEDAPIAA
ncbi:Eco57I restriction-modification methylase domain-containing protein [Halobacteriovorax sp. ZH5_bin.2]|uniref:Eco57I restriction-modification methylase domain-containing protein n=1 Tax=Halobacteriovorax sp. ZH5_bin.2 TaxID=3157727 RepID=UPI00371F8E65